MTSSGSQWEVFTEYPVNVQVPQGSIPCPILFLLYIKELPDDVISNIAIYDDDTALFFKPGQIFDLWQQLELLLNLNWVGETL